MGLKPLKVGAILLACEAYKVKLVLKVKMGKTGKMLLCPIYAMVIGI